MDPVQIAEMKNKIVEELKQIEALKQSMEQTLIGFIEWEKNLQGATPPGKTAKRRPPAIKEVQPIPPPPVKPAEPSPGYRVNEALAAIHGEFTRSQLLTQVESDGKGGIDGRAYGNAFSKLLKKQRIQCVKGSPRQRDSLYMRSGEKKTEQSPLS